MLLSTEHDIAHLAQVKSLWDVMGYPKLWGASERSPYYYDVMMRSGNGSLDRVTRTSIRQQALTLLATLPEGSYVAMYHSQTHAQLGEQGRATPALLAILCTVLEEWEQARVQLIELGQRRVTAELALRRDLAAEAELNRAYVDTARTYDAALNQARVLVCACLLPPETVTW